MRVSMVLVSGLFVGLLGCTDKGGDTGGEGDGDGTALVGDAANGATIYASTCASCHGVDGVGGASGPSLVAYVPAASDADLTGIVDNGKGSMPDMGLSAQEVADVVAYLRETFGG
jgi:mono/diheme cytochrome c family protein